MNTRISDKRCSNCKFWDYEKSNPSGYSECKRIVALNRKITDAGYKCEHFESKFGKEKSPQK